MHQLCRRASHWKPKVFDVSNTSSQSGKTRFTLRFNGNFERISFKTEVLFKSFSSPSGFETIKTLDILEAKLMMLSELCILSGGKLKRFYMDDTEICWRLSEFPLQCYQSAFKQHSPEEKLGNCILRFAWEEGFEIWQFDLNTDEFSIVCALELTNTGHGPFLLSVKISVRSWLLIGFLPGYQVVKPVRVYTLELVVTYRALRTWNFIHVEKKGLSDGSMCVGGKVFVEWLRGAT